MFATEIDASAYFEIAESPGSHVSPGRYTRKGQIFERHQLCSLRAAHKHLLKSKSEESFSSLLNISLAATYCKQKAYYTDSLNSVK